MPVIRCSNEVYKALQDKALQRGEPVSIVLDRVIWGLDTITPKPKPKRKAKAKAKVNPGTVQLPEPVKTVIEAVKPWPWSYRKGVGRSWRCGKCKVWFWEDDKVEHERACPK